MIGTALALGGLASLAGGVGNYAANKSASDRAEMLQNQALQEWVKVNIPDPKQQQIALQNFVQQGVIDPQLEHAIRSNPTEFEKVVTAPKYAAAQDRALSELENIGYSGGLRLQDKAALQDAMLQGQTQDRAERQGISADMARRGLGGSGFDVAAQLQGQQGAADRDANTRLKVAASAQDRALQAIQGAGDMATKYRTQDFGEQSAKASAADKINMFNTENLRDVQQRNVGLQNQANQMNLAEQQRIADQNTKQANYQQEYNKGLAQQQFENEAKVAAGKSGQYGQLANNAQQQGQLLGNTFSNAGSGISGAAAAASQQDFWDNYFKKK